MDLIGIVAKEGFDMELYIQTELNHTLCSVDDSLLNSLKEMYMDPRGQLILYRIGLSLATKNEVIVSDSSIYYMIGSESIL